MTCSPFNLHLIYKSSNSMTRRLSLSPSIDVIVGGRPTAVLYAKPLRSSCHHTATSNSPCKVCTDRHVHLVRANKHKMTGDVTHTSTCQDISRVVASWRDADAVGWLARLLGRVAVVRHVVDADRLRGTLTVAVTLMGTMCDTFAVVLFLKKVPFTSHTNKHVVIDQSSWSLLYSHLP